MCVVFWIHKGFQPSINISVMKGTRIYRLWGDIRKSPVKVSSHSQKAFIGKARSQVLCSKWSLDRWLKRDTGSRKNNKRLESDFPTTNRKPRQCSCCYLVGKSIRVCSVSVCVCGAWFGSGSWQTVECECVYVDKLHCTLNGVCDYTSSCVLHRPCPCPPLPPLSLSCFPPFSPRCLLGNHVVTLPDSSLLKSAVDKNSPRLVMWKRFSRHTAYISPPSSSPITTNRSSLSPPKWSTKVFPSPAHLWRVAPLLFSSLFFF